MIRRFKIGFEVESHKRTLECALLTLIGPRSAAVAGVEGLPDDEHAHVTTEIGGVAVRAVRTSAGVDLILDSAARDRVWGRARRPGAVPVSEEAAECLRIESGRPRYGVDMDDSVIPQEAGLNERAVSFTKGCYVGQETVARLYYKGKPNRHLRGLRLSAPAAVGDELELDGRSLGHIGSVALSPRLGPIALALVPREAEPGAIVAVGEAAAPAEVVELPFAGPEA